jgi:glycine/D-amino acid oxidase-like deaminating enzyme
MTSFDHIIVGHGLAGACLAWALRWRGERVLVVDRETPSTASRIAAGLVTPITGKRLVKSWRLDELLPAATRFYRRAEAECGGGSFFTAWPQLRLFADERERAVYEARKNTEFLGLVTEPDPPIDPTWFTAPFGGCQFATAHQLATERFLSASRSCFEVRTENLNPSTDVAVTGDAVHLPRLGVSAKTLTFCEGFSAAGNPWFPGVTFNSAKGEILTVRIPDLAESRIVNRGVWLVPLGDGLFRTGATYDHSTHDCVPTAAARDEILGRLREFVRLPMEVVAHDAAVRPIIRVKHPTMGVSPQSPRIGFFNGLASKGSLAAPFFAEQFATFLCGAGDIEPEVRL